MHAQSDKGVFIFAPHAGINLTTYFAGSFDVTFIKRISFTGGV